ncbi:MAG: phaC [Bacillales bacterium]|jgi:polyhydroxyalkanoate synthase|nr:phaC [Bacillales bacterium]
MSNAMLNFSTIGFSKEVNSTLKRFENAAKVMWKDSDPLVGQTPKEIIWSKNKTKLYRYIPKVKNPHSVPILLIYALINKPYILDLTPGNSLIEYLVNNGFDVYLLDWGTPGLEDSSNKLEDYIIDYIPKAVIKVLRKSGKDDISILGYCMGGTMVSIFASLFPEIPIKNLIFLTSPFDFSNTGLYKNLLHEEHFNIDKTVDTFKNIPPEMIDFGNKMLKPITNFIGPYVSLIDRSENEDFVKSWKLMQKWLSDGIPFPGEAYRQWIREFYYNNSLIKGELVMRGKKVNLSNIKSSVLNISAIHDHIAMPCQVEGLLDHISSADKMNVTIPSGHVSVVFGTKSLTITYPTILKWLVERS